MEEFWKNEESLLLETYIPINRWTQLKETITEIRDNNKYEGNGVTEMCRFLINYMGVLEDEISN